MVSGTAVHRQLSQHPPMLEKNTPSPHSASAHPIHGAQKQPYPLGYLLSHTLTETVLQAHTGVREPTFHHQGFLKTKLPLTLVR
jgi:hypothetical protein